MKASFRAVVVGLSDTDSSPYVNGSVCVAFDVDSHAPLGETTRRVALPLFSKEQARELAALYRGDAVRITIESDYGPGSGIDAIHVTREILGAREDEFTQEAARRVMRELDSRAREGAARIALPTVASLALEREATDAHTELDKLGVSRGDGHGLVTRFTLANRITILAQRSPLVNGRPSCCEAAINSEALQMSSSARKWMLSPYEEALWCPFCRARLPEIPGAQP